MNTIGYLPKDKAEAFLDLLSKDYTNVLDAFTPIPNMIVLDMEYSKRVEDITDEVVKKKLLQDKFYKVQLDDAIKHGMLDTIMVISHRYEMYKNNGNKDDFLELYQKWVDIYSLLCNVPAEDMIGLAFLMNIMTKNGFFRFLETNDNVNVKIIRNIREHNNVVVDEPSLCTHYPIIQERLHYHFSTKEMEGIVDKIRTGNVCILYDRSRPDKSKPDKKIKVTSVLVEDTVTFLKKLLTLCHVILFCCGLNDKLVISRELFRDYWCKKYNVNIDDVVEITVDEHMDALRAMKQSVPVKKFNFGK